jgi:hypothetical protein
MWEYAKAAGYHTAYWTSQNLMFGNAASTSRTSPSRTSPSTHLDRQSPLDEGASDASLVDRAIAEWGELREPFFAVVHYSNVHFPYVYDPSYAPFQPAEHQTRRREEPEYFKLLQGRGLPLDIAVGRFVDHVRSTEVGQRTVLVYTSITASRFASTGSSATRARSTTRRCACRAGSTRRPAPSPPTKRPVCARRARSSFGTSTSCPHVLDLMGVWDDPALTPFRARMMGPPAHAPERTTEPVPMTNCSWVWECAFRNWGMMQGPLKLEAREWDHEYHCFHVLDDPEEQKNLGEAACGPLAELARGWFGGMPVEIPPGRPNVSWGKK